MTDEGKVPPCDLDAEASVLSAIMLEPQTLEDIEGVLTHEDFYAESHRRIFEAAKYLHTNNIGVDMVSIGSRLKDTNRIAQIGGMSYLAEILDACPIIKHAKSHAVTVRNKARMRKLIVACHRASAKAYLGGSDEVLDDLSKEILGLAESNDQGTMRHARDFMGAAIKSVMANQQRGGITGATTGLQSLDEVLTGLHAGDLTIGAGRPGMGKSSWAFGIGAHIAAQGKAVIGFSLEMPGEQLALRAACSASGVNLRKVRGGMVGPVDFERLLKGALDVGKLPFWIDEKPGATVAHIRAKCRKVQREAQKLNIPMGLMILDYIQLARCPGIESREQQVSEISRSMKELAKELSCPVIALSQLNRDCEKRGDKRPMMSDLRESGAIEQDADNIVFLYRDEVYNEQSKAKGTCELIVAKQRNGPTRTVHAAFDGPTTTFRNLGNGYEQRAAE